MYDFPAENNLFFLTEIRVGVLPKTASWGPLCMVAFVPANPLISWANLEHAFLCFHDFSVWFSQNADLARCRWLFFPDAVLQRAAARIPEAGVRTFLD